MEKTTTQNKRIMRHLMQGNNITPLQALTLYGCMRLSARIYELRASGVPIGRRMQAIGKGKYVALYYLQHVPHDKR